MTAYEKITRSQHAKKLWRRPVDYSFAKDSAVVRVVLLELSQAQSALPLAFVKQEDKFHLVGLTSFSPGSSLLVSNGKWLSTYIPSDFRSYPFRFIHSPAASQPDLHIASEGLAPPGGPTPGIEIFTEDGKPSASLVPILNYLEHVEASRLVTDAASAALAAANVMAPWEITIINPDGQQRIEGFYKIDESALLGLSDEAFLALRKTAAFPVAYAQMMSMNQLSVLEQLAKVHLAAEAATPAKDALTAVGSLDKFFGMAADDTVQFKDNVNFKF